MVMVRRKVEIIAVDLDGTLLGRDARVPARNVEAIRRARARGVEVILATGKTRESAVPVIEELELTLPGVFFQGHIICDANGRVLREKAMDPALVQDLLTYVRRRDLPLIVYDRDGVWTPTPGAHRDLIHEKYQEVLPRLNDSASNSTGINKFLVAVGEDGSALRADLERRFGERLRVLQAVPEFFELMSPAVSKGEGVLWLLRYLAIDPRALLAVGDGENDVEMLQAAGTGVAVANAAPAAKAAADFIVASNEEGGVAEAIERFVLTG